MIAWPIHESAPWAFRSSCASSTWVAWSRYRSCTAVSASSQPSASSPQASATTSPASRSASIRSCQCLPGTNLALSALRSRSSSSETCWATSETIRCASSGGRIGSSWLMPPMEPARTTVVIGRFGQVAREVAVSAQIARGGLSVSALDLAATDQRVAPVGVADPRLVRAVVVGAEEDQRRLLAADAARLVALGIHPTPDADERVLLPLLADRRRQRVTRVDPRLVRQRHELVHDRVDLVRVPIGAAVACSADRPLEEAVAGEAVRLVDEQRVVLARMSRRGNRADLERARPDRPGERRDHGHAPALRVHDVIPVAVGDEDVRQLDAAL